MVEMMKEALLLHNGWHRGTMMMKETTAAVVDCVVMKVSSVRRGGRDDEGVLRCKVKVVSP